MKKKGQNIQGQLLKKKMAFMNMLFIKIEESILKEMQREMQLTFFGIIKAEQQKYKDKVLKIMQQEIL